MASLEVIVADITTLAVDAIVNAANAQLAGGGGVDGAIHRAAGSGELHAACRALGGCHTGDAKITPGFRLPARLIIHAVGPVWRGGGDGEAEQLASCYRRSLDLAREHACKNIAFPAISTGVYAFPAPIAAEIAVETVEDWLQGNPAALERVIFCCFSKASAELHRRALHGRPG